MPSRQVEKTLSKNPTLVTPSNPITAPPLQSLLNAPPHPVWARHTASSTLFWVSWCCHCGSLGVGWPPHRGGTRGWSTGASSQGRRGSPSGTLPRVALNCGAHLSGTQPGQRSRPSWRGRAPVPPPALGVHPTTSLSGRQVAGTRVTATRALPETQSSGRLPVRLLTLKSKG